MVELLVEHGANANILRNDSLSPLYFAANKGYSKIVNYLIRHEANYQVIPKHLTKEHASTVDCIATEQAAIIREQRELLIALQNSIREKEKTQRAPSVAASESDTQDTSINMPPTLMPENQSQSNSPSLMCPDTPEEFESDHEVASQSPRPH